VAILLVCFNSYSVSEPRLLSAGVVERAVGRGPDCFAENFGQKPPSSRRDSGLHLAGGEEGAALTKKKPRWEGRLSNQSASPGQSMRGDSWLGKEGIKLSLGF
jgi:hypothetical protein